MNDYYQNYIEPVLHGASGLITAPARLLYDTAHFSFGVLYLTAISVSMGIAIYRQKNTIDDKVDDVD